MPAHSIYLDNHATTRTDPRVVEAMLPFFTETFGNAGSTSHTFGWDARDAVKEARTTLANAIGATDRELIFTSGATESNNLALKGVSARLRRRGNHIITVKTEHRSVLDPVARLSRHDFEVTLLDVDQAGSRTAGIVDPQKVSDAIRPNTILVSVMLANNEIGVIQPIANISAICRERNVVLHTDATQAIGKMPVDVERLHVDLMSFSAHKIYGPKGIGALYVRRKNPLVRLEPLLDGGGQEHGIRSGTLNVAGIVGFAKAIELCLGEMSTEPSRLSRLRDQLFHGLCQSISDVQLNGPALEADVRLPGNLNCTFGNVDGEALMMSMRELAVSSGSACTSVNPEPSHVLRALGLSDDQTRSSLRFGFGRFNTAEDVEFAISTLTGTVERLRSLRP